MIVPTSLYQLESIIILIGVLFSYICNFILQNCDNSCISKNVFKCILKNAVSQYYAMKSKNFLLLIIDLNNIHGFNILRYVPYGYFPKKQEFFTSILYHVYAL